MRIGIDIGSTTIKCCVLDEANEIIYKSYKRHYSQIAENLSALLSELAEKYEINDEVYLGISGSAGMGIAELNKIPFVQEVYATRIAARARNPKVDTIIELGGEDAKILFLSGGLEVRMNGTCAGGTGAFIDQMATLLNVSLEEMNELAKTHEKVYTIASRCGVFAKSDVQPLLNQGAKKGDVAASIYAAVANQTIAGLAQGREIKGNVMYLGGPLTFMSELRQAFDTALGIVGECPENSLYYVAYGTALGTEEEVKVKELIERINTNKGTAVYQSLVPLFKDDEEYEAFMKRHASSTVPFGDCDTYKGKAYIGVDAGSTTIKMVVIDEYKNILKTSYQPNKGNPVSLVKDFLIDFLETYPNIELISGCVTGYGEDIVKNAFNFEYGIVETIAHFLAAKEFMPNVDFIIDIGGQDMKCFKIHNGQIDHIFLNEACSSGCGSFLQTFANALGYEIADFARLGLKAEHPVDLGSRCTVFMNSMVKQAQKDGATVEDISAGLSISVVKNALYKVIRCASAKDLGTNIVVQGGTFKNDSVLRAFENELGTQVIRPTISELMGAYGCALYAATNATQKHMISLDELHNFIHQVSAVTCGLCNNHCNLTVNTFANNRKFIGGNRCERPITKKVSDEGFNLYEYKRQLLYNYGHRPHFHDKVIGIPMVLNMYDLLPFWTIFFNALGYDVEVSEKSTHALYLKGQATIPSDTVCYPAKLVHGHIKSLIDRGVTTIFYPCMTYNFDEGLGDNHYNCPVVAYYPEVIEANMPQIESVKFINDHIGVHHPKEFCEKIVDILKKYDIHVTTEQTKKAYELAYNEYSSYRKLIYDKGQEIMLKAQIEGIPTVVLAGRPYHVDEEINHGIDKVIVSLDAAVISEDALSYDTEKFPVDVLNQWTFHSRMYAAAKTVTENENMELIQLVSFGCGVDAITSDEVRRILEDGNKTYTQLKIDEITNLGTVKIRLRSLFAALKMKGVK